MKPTFRSGLEPLPYSKALNRALVHTIVAVVAAFTVFLIGLVLIAWGVEVLGDHSWFRGVVRPFALPLALTGLAFTLGAVAFFVFWIKSVLHDLDTYR